MAKKFFPEVWEEIEINLEIPKNYYPEQKLSDGFYGYQNPDEGYEVRGVRPPCREIKNPEIDCY